MNLDNYFKGDSVKDLLKHLSIVVGILLFIGVIYFYIYLPNVTHHGEYVEVPDLRGLKSEEIEKILKQHSLRYSVNDSSYADTVPPLSVLRQFPAAGSKVKRNRIIYVSLNRLTPPTMPMPDIIDGSLLNAQAVLKSNELKLGRVYYEPNPIATVREIKFHGMTIAPGFRLPKGSSVDIIMGDGYGPADFTIGNLVGDSYEAALHKLSGWNLHLGRVEIMEGADTTGVTPIVFKQFPNPGDSVRVGLPVNLWLAQRGYKAPEKPDEGNP